MATFPPRSALLGGLLAVALLSPSCNSPEDRAIPVAAPEKLGLLPARILPEASGLAPSLLREGALWLINDSGDTPTLYLISKGGEELGRLQLSGLGANDWEACASFSLKGQPWLLVADTGDNQEVRQERSLIVVAEPDPARLTPGKALRQEAAWVLRFRFPEGAFDCEAVGVDPVAQKIYLITKRSLPPVLYTLPLRPPLDTTELVAERVGELDWLKPAQGLNAVLPTARGRFSNQPTDLSFSHDGRRAVLLTYAGAWLFEKAPGEDWAAKLTKPGQALPPHKLSQAEAACLEPDGKSLLITTEGNPAPLLRYTLSPR